ncbi:putative F-box protein [Arabidopsis thaliana]|nr:F-box associated interaction domain [Arabidopsis thaliana x Arabidopsis arenosa]KAG7659084.1 F-box associated interaction domain [Arabidopsis suecica]OAP14831.1 hypothetical protein AXX17_AT1G64510 [Arabidopsis thaliana]CAA0327659.1 unnamed protein product [Arabidopsis thaliana]CAD5316825.1 unnamed protein product [Arabidopsis thaliana]
MVNTSFETLALDMQIEILARLPLKYLMRCMCVSKKWASLIRGEDFRSAYLLRSMTRPRLLFVASRSRKFTRETCFHSVYQEPPLLLSGKRQMLTDNHIAPVFTVSNPILGLLCHQGYNNEIVICNPGLKKFRNLPQIQVPEGASVRSFFGYDKVDKVFKVLCVCVPQTQFGAGWTSKEPKKYQVYTVRSDHEKPSFWRPIICNDDHSVVTDEGLFNGGFLYYGARSSCNKPMVMRFNVSSEAFAVIKLPEEVDIDYHWRLVNYKGKVALVNTFDSKFKFNGVFEIWVRNEVDRKWDKDIIKIPQWTESVDNYNVYFKGTTGTKELVFAPPNWFGEPLFVLYYDKATTNLRRFDIEGMDDQHYSFHTFLDHVDSTWLM